MTELVAAVRGLAILCLIAAPFGLFVWLMCQLYRRCEPEPRPATAAETAIALGLTAALLLMARGWLAWWVLIGRAQSRG